MVSGQEAALVLLSARALAEPAPQAAVTVSLWAPLVQPPRVQVSLALPVSLAMPAAQVLLPGRAVAKPVPQAAVTASFWAALV